MSYKVMSHSLAAQVADLSDVFSTIETSPTAKDAILKKARQGLIPAEAVSVATLIELVDGVILYRYGWWDDVPASPANKTLKSAVKESWQRRKLRTKFSDEDTRIAKGRSSSQSVLSYENLTITQAAAGDPINVTLEVTPVYADGLPPESVALTVEQSQFQENYLGVVLGVPSESSGVFTLSFTIDPTTTDYLDNAFDASSSPIPLILVFHVSMSGTSQPVNLFGSPVAFPVSETKGTATLVVELS